ncbi:MAG: hypothetical protein DMG69_26855 [Acidobacteria bacterium]|nr:MAG: hypothetical protein DMG69_26855 [Acidobacteriota bacterium]
MLAKLFAFFSIALPLLLCAQPSPHEIAAHAKAAQAAEQRNDFSTAVHEYEFVAKALPQNAEMQSNLGVALYFNHDLKQAIRIFRRATAMNPSLLAPHLFAGLSSYRLSDPNAAVQELEKAVQINPADVIAHTWLGYAYTAQSQYEAALKEFQAARRLEPGNIDVWYSLGETYLQIGREATLELIAVAPDGGRTWQLAGEQSQLKGDPQEALECYKMALERRSDIPELRSLIADLGGTAASALGPSQNGTTREDEIYRRAHDAEQESRAAFEHVVQMAPDSYRFHQILGDAFTAEEKQSEAIEEYRTVLLLKPDLPGIHEAIGNNLLRSGKPAEALPEFEAELQLQPYSASAYTDLGQVFLIMGKDEEAANMLNKALQMDRPPIEVYRLLGKVELHRKQFQSAVENFTRYVSVRSSDSSAYYLLSQAYRALGKKDQMNQALQQFEKTSQDVKARSKAQARLQALNRQGEVTDEAREVEPKQIH